MIKYLQHLTDRNITSQHPDYAQKKEQVEDYHGEMKENYIVEIVTLPEIPLSQYILKINHTKYMNQKNGIQISEMP